MRSYDYPYITDWFTVSLRWLAMLGIVISLALGNQLTMPVAWPLVVLAVWNLVMMMLAGFNFRMSYHREIGVIVDTVLIGIFFWLQNGVLGPASWSVLLPILTAAMYFEIFGALGVAVVLAGYEIVSVYLQFPDNRSRLTYGLATLSTMAAGLLFGVLGRQLFDQLRKMRLSRITEEERRRAVENERLRAIYELTSTLTATLSYKRVLDSALDLSVNALNFNPDERPDDNLVSAVMLFVGNELITKSARRFTSADMRVSLPGAEGVVGKVLNDGEPVLTQNIASDPELGRIIALRTCASVYCFPLRSCFNVYGVLLFAHPTPNFFTEERRDVLDIIGRQAVIAVQNARLYQDLVEEKERMVEVHEEARKKLARDLHDGPTQSVSAMAMRLNLTRRMLERDPKAAADEIVKIEELAHRTTKEIRHMLFTLRPLVLESQGLSAALISMAEKMRETFSQNMIVNVDERLAQQLEMGKQGVIFYIVEEAVNNARKHARASNVWVTLRSLEAGLALLEIRDDGIGFDVKAIAKSYDKRGSLGMVNLRERTELVNGLMNIDSVLGKGTKIQVYIPLTEEATDRLHHPK
jgi:signal transduction histidine kinase